MRNVPEGKSFMRRHDAVIHNPPENFQISKDEIISFAKVKPNRRILWFRFNHSIYLLVNKDKLSESEQKAAIKCDAKNRRRAMKKKLPKECKTWRTFWAYTVGEPTVLLDTVKMKKSAEQMNIFLQKKGYFRSVTKAVVDYNDDSTKCKLYYHIYPGQPYVIDSLQYRISDQEMARYTPSLRNISPIKQGVPFDVDLLNSDREKVAAFFNDKGYYEFNKEYIYYDTDTTGGSVDLVMNIELPRVKLNDFPDSIVSVPHRKYFIGDVFVHTNYNISSGNYAPTDTLSYEGMRILSYGQPEITPFLISCVKGYSTGDLYEKTKIDRTYRRYSQMGVFRAVNIQLVPKESQIAPGIFTLDTHIRLTPSKRQSFQFDPHVTNRSGNMGIYGNIGYTHRNLFRGAESMDFKLITGIEASQPLVQSFEGTDNTGQQIRRNFKLNTFEFGPEITYRVPRLWPFGCDFTALSSDPQTSLSALLNYQRRPDYERTLSQIRFSYNWIENPDKNTRFSIDVLEFSVIKIEKSEAFQQFLDRLRDAYLANSYQDHLIFATNIGYTWNTQKAKYQRQYFFLRLGASGAGNLLNGLMDLGGAPVDSMNSHTIDGIRFAQYFRGEVDFIYYFNANDRNGFVLRSYGGIGEPRKNAVALPFEKSFFSGGSNGLRAWQARSLGPGSFRDPNFPLTFNNIGEIKLEGNFEYRFKLTKMFNWALFVDAGNIWLIHPDGSRPGADFRGSRFVSEIAVGAGLGVRLDFEYFLVRMDLGLQLKDPAKVQGERWLWQPKNEYLGYLESTGNPSDRLPLRSNLVFNLGIGFPF
jgi:outer membrane protein assembly factor BamA